jgi:NitT/TauT family transport system ATP-binding protein
MLAVRNLKKGYDTQVPIFENFNLIIEENKITCILGPSGIGKTTLLNVISGIINADSGDLSDFNNRNFSYIFQEPRLLRWKTVYDNINFVLKDLYPKKEADQITNKYIDMVGLTKFRDYYPNNISGGMIQRVSIARAFAYPSEILIMDEPFKSLDMKLKKNLISSFINLWEIDHRTIIFVTHDMEEAAYIGNNIFILKDSTPTNIKKEVNIDLPQRERLDDYQRIREIKKILIDNL